MSLTVEIVKDQQVLDGVAGEWAALHRRARPGTPFEHPAWIGTWARHFVPAGGLRVVLVRSVSGQLLGVAPLYLNRRLGALGPAAVQPLGTGHHQALTEVVQVLVETEHQQDVLRAVVRHVETEPRWDWFTLALGPSQGWFIPQWLSDSASTALLQRQSRACVVLALPSDPRELPGRLRRNVRESVRRARNRTSKHGGLRLVRMDGPADVARGFAAVRALHGARAAMPAKVAHVDQLSDPATENFVREAVGLLAEAGLARVHLVLDGEIPVAGLLVLSDGTTDYVSLSGLQPDYWDYNLNTLLVWEAMVHAVEGQRTSLNLSSGPDTAKMRWGGSVTVFHDFVVVRGTARARIIHSVVSHLEVRLRHHDAWSRHRPRENQGT